MRIADTAFSKISSFSESIKISKWDQSNITHIVKRVLQIASLIFGLYVLKKILIKTNNPTSNRVSHLQIPGRVVPRITVNKIANLVTEENSNDVSLDNLTTGKAKVPSTNPPFGKYNHIPLPPQSNSHLEPLEYNDEELSEMFKGNGQSISSGARYRSRSHKPDAKEITYSDTKIDLLCKHEAAQIQVTAALPTIHKLKTDCDKLVGDYSKPVMSPTTIDEPLTAETEWAFHRISDTEALVTLSITPSMKAEVLEKSILSVNVLLDKSSSMSSNIFSAKESIKNLISSRKAVDVFSMMTFDDGLEVVIPAQKLNEDRQEVLDKVNGVSSGGGTSMLHGIFVHDLAIAKIKKNDDSAYPIINIGVTDGENDIPLTAELAADKFKIRQTLIGDASNDVTDIMLGIGLGSDYEGQLAKYMQVQQGQFINMNDPAKIVSHFEKALKKIACRVLKPTVSLAIEGDASIVDIWHDGVQPPVKLQEGNITTFTGINLQAITNGKARSLLFKIKKNGDGDFTLKATIGGKELVFNTQFSKNLEKCTTKFSDLPTYHERVALKSEAVAYRETIDTCLNKLFEVPCETPAYIEELNEVKIRLSKLLHMLSGPNFELQSSLVNMIDRIEEAEKLVGAINEARLLKEEELNVLVPSHATVLEKLKENLKEPEQYIKKVWEKLNRHLQRRVIFNYDPEHLSPLQNRIHHIVSEIQYGGHLYFPGSAKECEQYLLADKEIYHLSSFQGIAAVIQQTIPGMSGLPSHLIANYACKIGGVLRPSTIPGRLAFSYKTKDKDDNDVVMHDAFYINPINGHLEVDNVNSKDKAKSYKNGFELFEKRIGLKFDA
ncbi:MAG: VWA domain-containing protein [Parachlamydiaceae bacterium]|nr:VWA domain-containing protein [Parachlamydiaceae bacterium]